MPKSKAWILKAVTAFAHGYAQYCLFEYLKTGKSAFVEKLEGLKP